MNKNPECEERIRELLVCKVTQTNQIFKQFDDSFQCLPENVKDGEYKESGITHRELVMGWKEARDEAQGDLKYFDDLVDSVKS